MNMMSSNPRSSLHALAPIGIGTAEVESLLSYLWRLAASHSVSVTEMSRASQTLSAKNCRQTTTGSVYTLAGTAKRRGIGPAHCRL